MLDTPDLNNPLVSKEDSNKSVEANALLGYEEISPTKRESISAWVEPTANIN